MSRKRSPRPNIHEHRMARALDELAEYDTFTSEIAPLLRQAVREGWSADKLKDDPKIKTLLLARKISIALQEKNPGAALAAIKDYEDRAEGKAIERKEVHMALEQAPEEEIDARLKTLLADEGDTIQ